MHIDEKEVDTRNVAAWTSETGDKAGCDWIDAASEDDRDRRGCTFRRDSRWAAKGSNHIDTVGDEIRGQCGQPIIVSLRPAVFDRHVLAIDVARLAQSLVERGDIRRSAGRQAAAEIADHR